MPIPTLPLVPCMYQSRCAPSLCRSSFSVISEIVKAWGMSCLLAITTRGTPRRSSWLSTAANVSRHSARRSISLLSTTKKIPEMWNHALWSLVYLFLKIRLVTKKTSKLHIAGPLWMWIHLWRAIGFFVNSKFRYFMAITLCRCFTSQRANDAESVSVSWRHHEICSQLAIITIIIVISHYSDVIMSAMASQTTSLTIVYSTVYSGSDQRKHQSSASLAFVRGIVLFKKHFSQRCEQPEHRKLAHEL